MWNWLLGLSREMILSWKYLSWIWQNRFSICLSSSPVQLAFGLIVMVVRYRRRIWRCMEVRGQPPPGWRATTHSTDKSYKSFGWVWFEDRRDCNNHLYEYYHREPWKLLMITVLIVIMMIIVMIMNTLSIIHQLGFPSSRILSDMGGLLCQVSHFQVPLLEL